MSTFVKLSDKLRIRRDVINNHRQHHLVLQSVYGFNAVPKVLDKTLFHPEIIPPSIIWPYAGASIPNGFIPLDGSYYSRPLYSNLFQKVGTTWGIGDLSFFTVPDIKTPLMTTNSTPSGVASANLEHGGNFAYHSLDRNNSTYWESGEGTGWLRYQFTTAKTIRTYALVLRYNSLKSWTFEGSNDGTNWTVLDTRTNISSHYWNWFNTSAFTTKLWFEVASPGSYTYYRINVNQSHYYCMIHEWEMYEKISTSFNIPNSQRRTMFGDDAGWPVGQFVGGESHILDIFEVPFHSHPFYFTDTGGAYHHHHGFKAFISGVSDPGPVAGPPWDYWQTALNTGDSYLDTGLTGSGTGHENRQESFAVNFIMKY